MKFFRWKIILPSLLSLFLIVQFVHFNHKIIHLRKNLRGKIKKHKNKLKGSNFVLNKIYNKHFELPKELKKVPIASDYIILETKKIPIQNIFAPYNASIIEKEDGYWLFFRHDRIHNMYLSNKIYSYIGCVELDKNLEQKSEHFLIDTKSIHSEDPRVFKKGNDYLLIFNDILDEDDRRGMHLAKVDFETKEAKDLCPIDLRLNPVEKNWAPFIYQEENEQDSICFEYQISHPRQILQLKNTFASQEMEILQQKSTLESIPWEKKWGTPMGGTPARLVNGEYLGFFHSKFKDKSGIYWYVFGAYTFEKQAPFRITKVSPYPILFDGIYDSEYLNTAEPSKCVIFPGSYAIIERDEETLIQLSCGENDSSMKVITFDKNELLQSLVPVEKK